MLITQVNGQVETVNKIIKHTLKTKLEVKKGAWAYELLKVLWAYRTTTRSTIRETPFSMVYGTKVKLQHFKKGNLVIRLLLPGARNPQEGVLGPNWEGLYVVDEDLRNRAYHIVNVNGARVPRAWNVEHLHKYYQ
ncbi:hypothetical protein ACOSP7_007371 [Xanthoceras sorbifolium]